MPSNTDVQQALLDYIDRLIKKDSAPQAILAAAEAYAWLSNPNQPHGGK